MAGRYKTHGDWVTTDRVERETYGCKRFTVITEKATVTDTRTGDVFRGGAIRVSTSPKFSEFRTKTFIGETAWSDAERHANDCAIKVQRAH